MNNQQAVVDQIVQNLAFDVEAVPKNELTQTTSVSQSKPLNVKIKVRKKDEIQNQNVTTVTDNTSRTVQKVRLVNSDRTIMTFDVFMEAEFEKKPSRKLRKHIFDMLRPGICLGAVDDDECPYMPSPSYSANITKPTVATKSDGTLKQTFVLSKNVYQDYSVSTKPGEPKWLFGTCKPGGCLDPPFGEDKYTYKPSTRSGPEREEDEQLEAEDVESDALKNKKPIKQHDEESQSNGRQSSIIDSVLFKKKRKSNEKSTNTKLPEKTDSIVDIYPGESMTNSASAHSNPIITYPPKRKNDPRISDDKTAMSRGPSEDRPRKSFNEHSEPYFTRPKGVQRIKEQDSSDPNSQPELSPSDAADVKNLPKESSKMPVPIPIPILIPAISSKQKPEDVATNHDIIKKDSIPEGKLRDQELHKQELQSKNLQDQELHGAMNLKDPEIPPRSLRKKSESEDTDEKSDESPKTATLIPSNVEKPTTPHEIDDQNLNESKETDNIIEDSAQPESFKIPVVIPVPFPLNTQLEGPKDEEPGLEENESLAKTPPKINMEEDIIPENFLTRGGFSDQENDTEIPVTLDPITDKNIKRVPKGENNTKKDMTPDSKEKVINDEIGKPLQQKYSQDYKKRDSPEEKSADGIEKPRKPSQIEDMTTSPAKHKGENIKRDSKGEEIDTQGDNKSDSDGDKTKDAIITPTELNNFKDTVTIPTNNVENDDNDDMKRDSEAEAIANKIVKPAKQETIKEKDIADKAATAKYENDTSDIFWVPDKATPQIKGTSKEDDHQKESQIISPSKLKKSVSPDKYWDNIGHEDTDLPGIHKDEKRSSLLSEPESETDTGDEINKHFSNKQFVDDSTKSNIIAAPVIIDNTGSTSVIGPIKFVYKETDLATDLASEPMDLIVDPLTPQIGGPGFKKFDDDKNLESVKQETKDLDPSTSTKKEVKRIVSPDKRVILPGDTVLSSVQSASTLKSAMKKDTISIDFGFHSYLNDKNERIVQTFDSTNASKRLPSDSVTVIKSQVRISSEIRIPVDWEHDISIQIKKVNANQRVSLSESGLVNVIEHGTVKKQRSPAQCTDVEKKSSEVNAEGKKESDATADRFLDYYEHELVPLQQTIKNLRNEIEFLATQQTMFKDKLYCPNKSKLPRLVHSNKKCFGCMRK